jgi:hypothetical protein
MEDLGVDGEVWGGEREISEGYMDTTTEKQGPLFLLYPGFQLFITR